MPATSTDTAPAAPANSRPDLNAFLDELLAAQGALHTPVARFAEAHARADPRLPALRSQLIPLTAPGPGEQYAFEVDLDACSGCKACVAGCHSLNGLDETETWRDVGLVLGGDDAHPFQQTITSACHHCADPACANGCPVLAYEKDPVTGVVHHLDDQCIGCSYCVLKCPYDVPKYNHRLGIVRKCDLCHGRLAAGEAPACVEACPTHAITITKVPVATVAGAPRLDTSAFLPIAPDPGYTQPSTRYVSRRGLPAGLRPADATALRPQPAHTPLALMLVLTQLGVGLTLAATFLAAAPAARTAFVTQYVTALPGGARWFLPALAALATAAGLAASVAHLGQPLRAWRVFLGLRKSWLSREAVLFGAFAPIAATAALLNSPAWWSAASATGLAAVVCSVMIYVDTRRRAWRSGPSALRMGGTVIVAALAFVAPAAAALALAAKLALEALALRGPDVSARLLRGPLRRAGLTRFGLGLAATALFAAGLPLPALALWLAGEFAERHLYFRAVDAPKMPGQPA